MRKMAKLEDYAQRINSGDVVAYVDTFIGLDRIVSVNFEMWWIMTEGRSWASDPKAEIIVEVE